MGIGLELWSADLVILSAFLTTLCRAFWSAIKQLPYEAERLLVRILSVVPPLKVVGAEEGRSALLVLRRKWRHYCAFLTREVVLVVRSSVICTPRNLVPFTALPLMMSGVCVMSFFL